ncbi:unnamed protein product [Staurois parvus]|uniref:Uncharacterized protein n=1 Tax=Staurois parvus TaxID=386267 RepID=A0ABN9G3U1_9NEOB|nr:unnamed protein product [Staurois parvus]
MEYAMMVAMGAVTDQTIIVTVVHDCQVLDFLEELLGDHDLTVDYILTPTRVIKTDCTRPKPKGIIWSKISHEMMKKIPILKKLWDKERRLGKDVTLKDEPDSSMKNTDHTSTSLHSNREALPSPVRPKAAHPPTAETDPLSTSAISLPLHGSAN